MNAQLPLLHHYESENTPRRRARVGPPGFRFVETMPERQTGLEMKGKSKKLLRLRREACYDAAALLGHASPHRLWPPPRDQAVCVTGGSLHFLPAPPRPWDNMVDAWYDEMSPRAGLHEFTLSATTEHQQQIGRRHKSRGAVTQFLDDADAAILFWPAPELATSTRSMRYTKRQRDCKITIAKWIWAIGTWIPGARPAIAWHNPWKNGGSLSGLHQLRLQGLM